jgi:HNH endonuclease
VSPYVSVGLQCRIRDRFANYCAYCQTAEALTAMTFEFEHILPLSAGGQTIWENLCLACPTCNRHKADRQTAVDPFTGQNVPLFHPQRQVWVDHFKWSEDALEIVGLTSSGRATIVTLQMNRSQLVGVRKLWVKLEEHPPKL